MQVWSQYVLAIRGPLRGGWAPLARPTRGSTSSGPWLRSRYSACAYSRERQRVGSGHDYVGEEGMLFR